MAKKARKRRRKNGGKNLFFITIVLLAAILVWHYGLPSIPGYAQTFFSAVDGNVSVHFIDVGQGDSTLIQTEGGNVLIDGGDRQTSAALVRYLKDSGVNRIAYVIATHPHSDHIAGLINVLGEFDVDTIIMPRVAHTTVTFERFIDAIEKNNITLQEPVAGSVFTIGGAAFTIVAPNSSGYRNLNNYSVAVRMLYGSVGFLFTGDAESLSENEMLQRNRSISAKVLHVGHHGSETSTTQVFLDAVSPDIAVISVGAGNSYGHPHREVLNRLENTGVTIYRTDIHGTIVMSTDGSSLTVR